MKTTINVFGIFTLFAAALIIVGCAKKSSGPVESSPNTSTNFTLTPSDNQTGVQLNQKIQINFAKSVDPAVVENNFHLISQKDMADSTCPFGMMMNHGNMSMSMMDTMKMKHLGQYHAAKGKFTWNTGNTSVTFTPDSLMIPKMQYMVHIGKEMMQMMQNSMGNMGGMSGHGSGAMKDDMMFHFNTMDTTGSTGSGHLGHH